MGSGNCPGDQIFGESVESRGVQRDRQTWSTRYTSFAPRISAVRCRLTLRLRASPHSMVWPGYSCSNSVPPSTVFSIPFNYASTASEPFDRHRQWTPSPHCRLLESLLISLIPSRRSIYVLRLPEFPSLWVLMFLRLHLLATPYPQMKCLQLQFLGLFLVVSR